MLQFTVFSVKSLNPFRSTSRCSAKNANIQYVKNVNNLDMIFLNLETGLYKYEYFMERDSSSDLSHIIIQLRWVKKKKVLNFANPV